MSQDLYVLGPDGIYRSPLLAQFDWLDHGFGTRQANPSVDTTLRQIHSNRVLTARDLLDRAEEGDALVTDEIGRAIGIRTADCVSLLFADPEKRAVAAVHAGWRGTAAAISSRTLEAMAFHFGTAPQDVHVAIGPAIRSCCYGVGAEVAAHFQSVFPELEASTGPACIDLPEANRRQLQAAGVPPGHIADCHLCTRCEADRFFSYRREPQNPGRLVASITRLR